MKIHDKAHEMVEILEKFYEAPPEKLFMILIIV